MERGEAFLRKLQQETRLNNCFLLPPQLPSTYGPQTPSDMWSLPQDVTIATDPLGLRRLVFPLLPPSLSLLSGAGVGGAVRLCWDSSEAVIPSASLTSRTALQGYGDDLAELNE